MFISPSSRLVFPFNHLLIRGISLALLCLLSLSLGCRILSVSPSLALSRRLAVFGITWRYSSPLLLMNRHGQNESSSVPPKARLCPRGSLAGRISMRPVGSVCTDSDRPGAPLAPHTLNRIMQPCLHRRAWSMRWTPHANSCQEDTLAWWD